MAAPHDVVLYVYSTAGEVNYIMVLCTHGGCHVKGANGADAAPAVCGGCLIDTLQIGKSSASLYEALTKIKRELELHPDRCPVSDMPLINWKLCDCICHSSADIIRTYSLRCFFLLRQFISAEKTVQVLEQVLADTAAPTYELKLAAIFISLCLAIPVRAKGAVCTAAFTRTALLDTLPFYNRVLKLGASDASCLETLTEAVLLCYVLALQLAMGLLQQLELVQAYAIELQVFVAHIQHYIDLMPSLEPNERVLTRGVVVALQCYHAVLSLLVADPVAEHKRRSVMPTKGHSQPHGEDNAASNEQAQSELELAVAAFQLCFAAHSLQMIDLSSVYLTKSSSALQGVYTSMEPHFTHIYVGIDHIRCAITERNTEFLINCFFALPTHDTVTRAVPLWLLAALLVKGELKSAGSLLNNLQSSVKENLLTEISTLVKFHVMIEDLSAFSTVVAGVLSSNTSYSMYTKAIEYLNEVLTHPLTPGTILLLSLPIIVNRDDFPTFLARLPADSATFHKSKLVIQHVSGKIRQGRVVNANALLDTMFTYCDYEKTPDIAVLEELATTLSAITALDLDKHKWYQLFMFVSPCIDSLLAPEEDTADIQQQKLRMLETQLLHNLITVIEKYWQLNQQQTSQKQLSISTFIEAVNNLRTYGRSVFSSIDSATLWALLTRLVHSKRSFDVVGVISFVFTQLDLLHDELSDHAASQRYLSILITIFLAQTPEYQMAETGTNIYMQIWRHLCPTKQRYALPFSCEEAAFVLFAVNKCSILTQHTEALRPRIQLVCTFVAEQRQHGCKLDLPQLVQLCFLDTAQNYRASYPTLNSMLNRYKMGDCLASIAQMSAIDTVQLCTIIGLSSVSPGFSLQFAILILCRVCYKHLVAEGILVGNIDINDINVETAAKMPQATYDALERLLKRAQSKQGTLQLPGILLLSLAIESADTSDLIEIVLKRLPEAGEDSANSDVAWIRAAIEIVLNKQSDSTPPYNIDTCTKDQLSTLLTLHQQLQQPVTISTSSNIGVAVGALSQHVYAWPHAAPQIVQQYIQWIEKHIMSNPAVKAMSSRGFIFMSGDSMRCLTPFEKKLSWEAMIKSSTAAEHSVIHKRILFLTLLNIMFKRLRDNMLEKGQDER